MPQKRENPVQRATIDGVSRAVASALRQRTQLSTLVMIEGELWVTVVCITHFYKDSGADISSWPIFASRLNEGCWEALHSALKQEAGSQWPAQALPSLLGNAYSRRVVAKSTTGCGSPTNSRRNSAHDNTIAGAFFVLAVLRYGGCAQGTFGCAGVLEFRSSTPAYSRRPSCGSDAGDSSTLGAPFVKYIHAPNPSARLTRANAHRAMALAALRANSSLATRLKRYHHHMECARQLVAITPPIKQLRIPMLATPVLEVCHD